MGWHNLIITKPSVLSVKHGQLLCNQAQSTISLNLEDIASIVLDTHQIQLTTALLSEFSEHNIAVIICNEQHLPNGILTSINPHSKRLPMLQMQVNSTVPFNKNLWKEIVKQKITNQASVLNCFGCLGSKNLERLSKSISSGDSNNREAVAAKKYFSSLFKNFTRRSECKINFALNYGYAILRANIARQILGFGFTAELGIHHKNPQNRFNLADDLIEPFRPLLDAWVKIHFDDALNASKANDDQLAVSDKALLISSQQIECRIDNQLHTIQSAIFIMVKSLSSVFKENDIGKLKLPQFSAPVKVKSLD